MESQIAHSLATPGRSGLFLLGKADGVACSIDAVVTFAGGIDGSAEICRPCVKTPATIDRCDCDSILSSCVGVLCAFNNHGSKSDFLPLSDDLRVTSPQE